MDESDAILQAVVFVEDANTYRSIHHKVDTASLKLYRFHYSRFLTCIRYVTIITLHLLAFFEYPSSLSWSSSIKQQDPRLELSCWTTQSVEIMCLLLLAADLSTKIYVIGLKQFLASKWMIADVIVLLVSFIDWSVSVSVGCNEVVRVRRMLRPFFILQHSSLMKKIVNCLRRTVPEVFSILLMLAFHLYIFSLLGMLIFPQPPQNVDWRNITRHNVTNNTVLPNTKEEKKYFKNLSEAFMSMLILLTTANNPDIMMPAYNQNRLYSIYFVLFLTIGLYCFMNMLTAVIYNQFRGYFLNSMQSSLFRRRVAIFAAFSVLNHQSVISESSTVEVGVIQRVIEMADLSKTAKSKMHQKISVYSESFLNFAQFKDIFSVIDRNFVIARTPPPVVWVNNTALQMLQRMANHIYFLYFSMFVACLNVILLTVQLNVQYEKSMASTHTLLMAGNFVFLIYYVTEQFLKIWAAGIKRYFFFKGCLYDCGITLILVIVQMVTVVRYGLPFSNEDSYIEEATSLRNLIRLTNILIIIRLIRIIPLIKTLALVASTLLDLVQNLKAFAGILVVIFYSYALLGMELFQGAIIYNPVNNSESSLLSPQPQLDAASKHSSKCGSYQQLEYWANNFDDFASSLIVLWDIMVVNNWQVFLSTYASVTSKFSYLYFIFWWLFSVVIVLNLLTALILENFIMKWDRLGLGIRDRTESMEETTELLSLHAMFRRSLEEPSEQDLLMELRSHSYINLN